MNRAIIDHPEFQATLRHVMEEKIPFYKLLAVKLDSLDPESPRLRVDMREDLIGNFAHGMLHGGVIASLLDGVAGLAIFLKMVKENPREDVMAQLKEFAQMSTIDLRIDFLQPGRGEYFVASAEVTRLGKRVANVLMSLHNDKNERIATGATAFMLHARAGK